MPSCAPSSSIRRTLGTRMASLIRVVSRLTGRECSTGRRLGLKGKSPSWAYSSSIRCGKQEKPLRAAAPFQRNLSTRLNPTRTCCPGGEERVRSCFSGVKRSKLFEEIRQRLHALASAPLADREARLALAVAEDDRERDLLELARADPLADRLLRLADVDPVPGRTDPLGDRGRGGGVRL